MAGEYTRFLNFSSAIPKYLLPIKDGLVLDAVLRPYAKSNIFSEVLLVCNEKDKKFHNIVEERLKYFNKSKTNLIYIKDSISQVDTAAQAIYTDKENNYNKPFLIANIDTILLERNFLQISNELKDADGLIDTFTAYDRTYSYVMLNKKKDVINIKEKIQISDIAASGLYGFNSFNQFLKLIDMLPKEVKNFSELYQSMIEDNKKIKTFHNKYSKNTIVVGTPSQYLDFISAY